MHRVTCTVAPVVSHSSVCHTGGLMAAKDFAFISRKNEGTTFGFSIVCDSLSLPPKWATVLSLSASRPISIVTSRRWAVERVHFQKQGKGSNFCFVCPCVLCKRALHLQWLWMERSWQNQIKPHYSEQATVWRGFGRGTTPSCIII